MVYKKYDFMKLLKEFNKKYETSYEINLKSAYIALSRSESGSFYIEVKNISKPSKSLTLSDFIFGYIIPDILSEVKIKDFVLNKEQVELNLKVEIWPPNKVKHAYLYTNYFSMSSNLGKSCMRVKEMQKALDFYNKNNTRIAVIVDDRKKIHARALLWDDVKSTKLKNPFTYLDRVYANSEHILPMLYDLAKENKWKQYPSTAVNNMNKSYYIDNIYIKDMCFLPYMDTFRYLYPEENLIASSSKLDITKHKDYIRLDQHTDSGYYPILDPDRVKEMFTRSYISKKDAIFVKRYDAYVSKKNIANIRGDYYSIHDKIIIESKLDGFMLKENSVEEFFTNNLIDKNEAVYSPKYDGFIHKSNIVKVFQCGVGNSLFHKGDSDITCFSKKWYHKSQCFTNYDRRNKNKEMEKQQPKPWILPNEYFLPEYIPYPDSTIIREGSLIPKKCAIIAYDIAYYQNNIIYQEVYCIDKISLLSHNSYNKMSCL